jgi:hypothetical protein
VRDLGRRLPGEFVAQRVLSGLLIDVQRQRIYV